MAPRSWRRASTLSSKVAVRLGASRRSSLMAAPTLPPYYSSKTAARSPTRHSHLMSIHLPQFQKEAPCPAPQRSSERFLQGLLAASLSPAEKSMKKFLDDNRQIITALAVFAIC